MSGKKKTSAAHKKVRREVERAARRMPKKTLIAVCVILIIAIVAFLLYWNYFVDPLSNWFNRERVTISQKAEGDLRVHFVDVGQGDSIVIEFPDGKVMVIDGGPREAKNKITAYIRALNISAIDYVVLTHADEDHVGSLDDVVGEFEVKNILMPGMTTAQITTQVYKQFCAAAEKEAARGAAKQETTDDSDINGGNYFVDFYADRELYSKVNSKSSAEMKNAVSPFIFLTYADRRIAFTGDANFKSEKPFLQRREVAAYPKDYDVDVLKVAHHGSETSTGEDWLNLVKPEHAVISCGEGNSYGHPRQEALERLEKAGVVGKEIYRTDLQGDVMLTVHDDGQMTFSVERGDGGVSVAIVRWKRGGAEDIFSGSYYETKRRINGNYL